MHKRARQKAHTCGPRRPLRFRRHCEHAGKPVTTCEYAGKPVTVKLPDGVDGPVEHAQALFKRAAKQRRAVDQLAPLIEAAQGQLEYVQEVQQSLTDLPRCVPRPRQHARAAMNSATPAPVAGPAAPLHHQALQPVWSCCTCCVIKPWHHADITGNPKHTDTTRPSFMESHQILYMKSHQILLVRMH